MTTSTPKTRCSEARTTQSQLEVLAIDFDHLARYTMGDRALEKEILDLYVGTLKQSVAALSDAANMTTWNTAAHTLKGSSHAVGAMQLASLGQDAERIPNPLEDNPERRDILTKIASATQELVSAVECLQTD